MRQLKPYSLFIVLGIVLTVPAFYRGLIPTDDIFVYSNWYKCFSAQVFAGEWYPRWLYEMNGGRGSPVFFFYPPFPFYVASIVGLLFPADSPAWFPLYLSYGLALGLSGITSYLFLKDYTDNLRAFLLALFYMLAPYHLFVNFYHRFAYPEFWAFTWAPLLFFFLAKSLRGEKKLNAGLAVTYALLLLTHLPTFIVLTPVIALFAFVFSEKKKRIITVVNSLACGLGLSGFYMLPMLMYQPLVSLDKMWEGKYTLSNNFLLASDGFSSNFLLKIAVINLFVLLLLCFATEKPRRKRTSFWLMVGLLSVFLMFEVSAFIWEVVPLMHKIQFPWRLNLLTLLSIVAVCAEINRNKKLLVALVSVVLVSQIVSMFMQILPLQEEMLSDGQKAVVRHETEARLGVVEYLPRWVSDEVYREMKYRQLSEMDERVGVVGEGVLSVVKWNASELAFQASSESGFNARIRQFYFPMWQAYINDDVALEVNPDQDGLINVFIPRGQHIVTLRLVKGYAEVVGIWISLITVSALIVVQLRNVSRARNRCL